MFIFPSWRITKAIMLCALGILATDVRYCDAQSQNPWVFTPADSAVMPLSPGVPGILRPVPANSPYGPPYLGMGSVGAFRFEGLPKDTLYPEYLADVRASRLSSKLLKGSGEDQSLWDVTLGGRFGLLRFTNDDFEWPSGWQIDVEGSAIFRMDLDQERDARATDYRAGVPISFSFGRLQTRVGYYHLSAHLGDEFLLKNPGYPRLNYTKDVLYGGASYWLTRQTRIYGEAGWAFYREIGGPWEFQFGIERAPRTPTGAAGGPFYALGAQFFEETDFSGAFTGEAGWAWRAWRNTGLLRAGLHAYSGKSAQFSFYNRSEQLVGIGLWYDY